MNSDSSDFEGLPHLSEEAKSEQDALEELNELVVNSQRLVRSSNDHQNRSKME